MKTAGMYKTAGPVLRWHKAHEAYLVDRSPVATVGLVWSQRNTDFYGRDDPETRVDQPWRGWTRALVRARIPTCRCTLTRSTARRPDSRS